MLQLLFCAQMLFHAILPKHAMSFAAKFTGASVSKKMPASDDLLTTTEARLLRATSDQLSWSSKKDL